MAKRIFREDLDRGPAHQYLGPDRFVEDDSAVFLCQHGQIGLAFQIFGPDAACVDEPDLALITGTWKDAIKMFTPDFEIRQYGIKTSNPFIPRGEYDHPEVERLAGARHRQVSSSGEDLYSVELYLNFLLDCPLVKGKPAILAEHLRDGCQRLKLAANGLVQHVRSSIRVRVLEKHGTYNFFRKLVNLDPEKLTPRGVPDPKYVLGFAACESRIRMIHEDESHRDPYLRIDNTYAKVMCLKILPKKTDDNMLSKIFAAPCDVIVASSWRAELPHKTERKARNRMDTFLSGAKKSKGSGNGTVLYDEAKLTSGQQMNMLIKDIEHNGESGGHYSLYAILHGDETRVHASEVEISKIFRSNERDGAFLPDNDNPLGGYLSTLPGSNQRDYRTQWISISNYAELSTIFSVDSGNVRNERLDAEYWTIFETKPPRGLFGRTPYYFNPLYGESQHLIVDGSPGSGKTFFLKMVAANAQKYKPFTVFFDLKNSFEGLTKRFGGTTISFADGAFGGNPLLLPESPENIQFQAQLIEVLIDVGGKKMNTDDKEGLHNYLHIMYRQPLATRRLHALQLMLREELAEALAPWVEGGQYGRFFDSPTDGMVQGDWINYSFQGMDSFKPVIEPLSFYALHCVRKVVFDPAQRDRLKLLILDEAWGLIKRPVILAYMEEAARTYRDKNGCMVICTQSLGDLPSWFLDYCPTIAVFKHNRVDRELYAKVAHFNDATLKEMESLRSPGEFVLANPDRAKVLQANLSEEELLVYRG